AWGQWPSEVSLQDRIGADAVLNAAPHFANGLVDLLGTEAQFLALLAGTGDIGLELVEQLDLLLGGKETVMGDPHGGDFFIATHAVAQAVKNHRASPGYGSTDPRQINAPPHATVPQRGSCQRTITFF